MTINIDPNFNNLATQKLINYIGNLIVQIVTLEARIEILQKQLEQQQQSKDEQAQ